MDFPFIGSIQFNTYYIHPVPNLDHVEVRSTTWHSNGTLTVSDRGPEGGTRAQSRV